MRQAIAEALARIKRDRLINRVRYGGHLTMMLARLPETLRIERLRDARRDLLASTAIRNN